jgi:hypothetical protein
MWWRKCISSTWLKIYFFYFKQYKHIQ